MNNINQPLAQQPYPQSYQPQPPINSNNNSQFERLDASERLDDSFHNLRNSDLPSNNPNGYQQQIPSNQIQEVDK